MELTFFGWVQVILERYGAWFVKGTAVTLLIAITGTVAGFAIGLLIGSVKTIPYNKREKGVSPKNLLLRVVNALLTCYVEVFRGTPMMVQAVVIYYGLLEVFGLDLAPITSGIIIVSLNTGAYMAELVRGGIESIDPGQTEAAQAVGMTHWQTMVNVILPQAVRNILPATGNEFIINIKDTSVLNVISVTELFFMTKSVNGVLYRTYETFLVAAVIYLVLTLGVNKILRYLERRMDGAENFTLATSSTMPESIIKRKKP